MIFRRHKLTFDAIQMVISRQKTRGGLEGYPKMYGTKFHRSCELNFWFLSYEDDRARSNGKESAGMLICKNPVSKWKDIVRCSTLFLVNKCLFHKAFCIQYHIQDVFWLLWRQGKLKGELELIFSTFIYVLVCVKLIVNSQYFKIVIIIHQAIHIMHHRPY